MFCSNCGQSLAENARFCARCGAPVGGVQNAPVAGAQGGPVAVPTQPPAYPSPYPTYAPYAPQPAAKRILPQWTWIAGVAGLVVLVMAILAIAGVFNPNSVLYGTWYSEDESLTLQFKRGGTVLVDEGNEPYVATYEFTGKGRMLLTPPVDMGGEPIAFTFQVEDEVLTLVNEQWNDTLTLIRVK